MNSDQELTPNRVRADGWRRTIATLALKGLKIPHTIDFQIDGANHTRATCFATLDELAKAIAAFDEAIERRSEGEARVTDLQGRFKMEEQREALVELQKRAAQGGAPASTTVIEALFPNVPVEKKTAAEKAEIERWLAIRKEEAVKIDPEIAEVNWWYPQTLNPYGVLDEWELPEELNQVGREYFARAPGSDIWVWFGDLPEQTAERLRQRGQSAVVEWWPFGEE
jgi:hypothetical protein